MSSSSSSVPIQTPGQAGSVAPTPQNTPLTTGPLTTALSKPTVPTIGEEEYEGEPGPPDTPPQAGPGSGPLAGLGPKGHNAILGLVQQRLQGLMGQSSGYIEGLPSATKKRVLALKGVQTEYEKLLHQYKKETLQLEKKYSALYKPLFDRRLEIVEGRSLPTVEELQKGHEQEVKDEEERDEEDDDEDDEDGEKEKEPTSFLPSDPIVDGEEGAKDGIPQFWLTTLRNHPGLAELITERDEEALASLKDVRVEHLGLDANDTSNKMGFRLVFEFAPNDFFNETTLSKTYYYLDELSYDGDFLYDHAEGTKITWKQDKDLTKEVEIKKQRNKHTNKTRLVKKARSVPSFFDFFSPPQNPTEEELENDMFDPEELEDLEGKLELDYQIGEDLKEKIIPRAIDYFTGKALQYELDDDDYSDDEDFEDDDEGDDDDEDDDEDDDDVPKRKAKVAPKGGAKKAAGEPDCKQQ